MMSNKARRGNLKILVRNNIFMLEKMFGLDFDVNFGAILDYFFA